MGAFKEYQILPASDFPVDVFINDNSQELVGYPSHWHDYIEIMFILDGKFTLQHNEHFFEANKNDMIIFHSGVVHSVYGERNQEGKLLVIQFLPSIISSSQSSTIESKYIFSFLNREYYQDYHIVNTYENFKVFFELVIGIYQDFTCKEKGYELYIKSRIYQLIVQLLRSNVLKINEYEANQIDLDKLAPLLKYIEENYQIEINLSQAAKMLNFSYSYFSKYFKKVTGKSFKAYVDFIRVCEAEKLILSSKMNISKAAYEVGFSDLSCFNRVYKRIRSCSPSSLKRTKTAKK